MPAGHVPGMLHLYALVVAASTAVLIFAGGLVTSTGSGLAVPDWPNSYGWFMFTFPLENMVGGIFYEHGHRLIASTVGFLILVMAGVLWRVEARVWVRQLGFIALAAVITQGILGGITVLWFLPAPISIAHASLAQLVFCITATIALATAPGWRRGYAPSGGVPNDAMLRKVALATTVFVYLQIVMGATMRHTEAGLAIPDFPWAFGRWVPPHWSPQIAIHFAHRVGALAVSAMVLATAGHILYHHRARRALVRPAVILVALVCVQVTLGALTVLSQKHYIINSLHVVTGGLVLVTSLVVTLRAHRSRFPLTESLGPSARGASASIESSDPGTTAAGARA
jgi:cytochrome c oxidase assembly protein subunit 15